MSKNIIELGGGGYQKCKNIPIFSLLGLIELLFFLRLILIKSDSDITSITKTAGAKIATTTKVAHSSLKKIVQCSKSTLFSILELLARFHISPILTLVSVTIEN